MTNRPRCCYNGNIKDSGNEVNTAAVREKSFLSVAMGALFLFPALHAPLDAIRKKRPDRADNNIRHGAKQYLEDTRHLFTSLVWHTATDDSAMVAVCPQRRYTRIQTLFTVINIS